MDIGAVIFLVVLFAVAWLIYSLRRTGTAIRGHLKYGKRLREVEITPHVFRSLFPEEAFKIDLYLAQQFLYPEEAMITVEGHPWVDESNKEVQAIDRKRGEAFRDLLKKERDPERGRTEMDKWERLYRVFYLDELDRLQALNASRVGRKMSTAYMENFAEGSAIRQVKRVCGMR